MADSSSQNTETNAGSSTPSSNMVSFDLKKLGIKEKHIMEFPQGLIGFASAKRFVLIQEASSERFMWLASVDRPDLAFLVIRPEDAVRDYNIDLEHSELEFLDLDSAKDAEVFLVVTVPRSVADATVNLQSPVVINMKRRLGKQIVLEQGRYPIQYALLKETASVGTASEK